MTKEEIEALGQFIIDNIDSFSDTLKAYIDGRDSQLKSAIETEVTTAKEDILNQIAINGDDLKALKDLLDSLDGEADGEQNLQSALLSLISRIETLEVNTNAMYAMAQGIKEAIKLAEGKFILTDTETTSTTDSTNDSSSTTSTSDTTSTTDSTNDSSSTTSTTDDSSNAL